eukprot:PhF_6_TR14193/c0_g1_i1/m.22731
MVTLALGKNFDRFLVIAAVVLTVVYFMWDDEDPSATTPPGPTAEPTETPEPLPTLPPITPVPMVNFSSSKLCTADHVTRLIQCTRSEFINDVTMEHVWNAVVYLSVLSEVTNAIVTINLPTLPSYVASALLQNALCKVYHAGPEPMQTNITNLKSRIVNFESTAALVDALIAQGENVTIFSVLVENMNADVEAGLNKMLEQLKVTNIIMPATAASGFVDIAWKHKYRAFSSFFAEFRKFYDDITKEEAQRLRDSPELRQVIHIPVKQTPRTPTEPMSFLE